MSKHILNHLIQNQVDFILFEEGSFAPLNWLLREGHLDYNEYLNWKKGTSKYLEDYFKTPTTTLITALKKVQDYAALHQLVSFRQTYTSTASQTLHFCRSSAHDHIFTTVYEPAHDRIQMDLFLDSADACAVFDLIRAVIDKRSTDINELVAKLEALNPDKHQQFTQLLAFEKEITQSRISSDKKIELLSQTVTPLAFELLGRFTHDFLTPLWHKLSVEIANRHFDIETPEYHVSFTAFKEFQWQQVLLSIEQEMNWVKQPILIFRYAESCFKLNKEPEGIANWFRLFVLFPEAAERLIKDSCNRLMFSDWQYFSELDPELESSLFPTWMVMNKPALEKNTVISDINCNESLQLIEKLVCNTEREINGTAINLRARLQRANPSLFVHYMRANSKIKGQQ